MRWKNFIRGLQRDESGQDLLEYALVLAVVLVAVVAGSSSVANIIATGLNSIGAKVVKTVQ